MENRQLSLILSVLTVAVLYTGVGVPMPDGAKATANPTISTRLITAAGPPPTSEQCGRKRLFGRPFSIEATGEPIPRKNVRRIITSNCRIRLNQKWSCISQRGNKSFLVWFLTDEIFEPKLTTSIRFKRYPCSKAHVTPRLFEHHSKGFPTRRQMLADDLIRCEMLASASIEEVESMIGLPDERSDERNRTYLFYFLGPERDSLVQIDPELLGVEVSGGTVQTLFIFQD